MGAAFGSPTAAAPSASCTSVSLAKRIAGFGACDPKTNGCVSSTGFGVSTGADTGTSGRETTRGGTIS